MKWDLQRGFQERKKSNNNLNEQLLGEEGNYQLTRELNEIYCMVATTVKILKLL